MQGTGSLFGLTPEQLSELQRQRQMQERQQRIAGLTQGFSTPGQQAMARIGAQAGQATRGLLGFDQGEDPDIAQARQIQAATQGVMNSPEFQKMDPFQQQAMLAREAAQTAARLGNPGLAMQLLNRAGSALSEQAAYQKATAPAKEDRPDILKLMEAAGVDPASAQGKGFLTYALQKSAGMTARDQKIEGLIGRGIDRGLAMDIVDGNTEYKVEGNNLLVIDKNSGNVTTRPLSDRGFIEKAQGTGASALADIPPTAAPGETMFDLAEYATGATNLAALGAKKVAGLLPFLREDNPQDTAMQAMRLYTLDLVTALQTNPKYAVAEKAQIQKAINLDAQVFDNPEAMRDRLQNAYSFLTNIKSRLIENIARSQELNDRTGVKEYSDQLRRVNDFIGAMAPLEVLQSWDDKLKPQESEKTIEVDF